MPVQQLDEVRILPPLATARVGSSPKPMSNYSVEPNDATGFRTISLAETLVVDTASGEFVGAVTGNTIRFKGAMGRVKSMVPFLETIVHLDGVNAQMPLTTQEPNALGLTPANLRCSVSVANLEVFRRAGKFSTCARQTNFPVKV